MATAIERSHIRMRPVSPMLTQSDTAPMVQKLVLLATAPKMNDSANAPPRTDGINCAGVASAIEVARRIGNAGGDEALFPDPASIAHTTRATRGVRLVTSDRQCGVDAQLKCEQDNLGL